MTYIELVNGGVYRAGKGDVYIIRRRAGLRETGFHRINENFFSDGTFHNWPGDVYTTASPEDIAILERKEREAGIEWRPVVGPIYHYETY